MEWLLLAIFCFVVYYFYSIAMSNSGMIDWFIGVFGILASTLIAIIIIGYIQ